MATPDLDEAVVDEPVVDDVVPDDVVVTCNLPGCDVADDLTRGLCPAHWCTHRGLASPDDEEVP